MLSSKALSMSLPALEEEVWRNTFSPSWFKHYQVLIDRYVHMATKFNLMDLDVEESVVAKVLAALTSLCELGLFQKMRIWELMSATLGFLYHPNIWIRQGTAAFIAAGVQQLPSSDVWCILYPSLRHFLRSDVVAIVEQNLLNNMKPPVSKH